MAQVLKGKITQVDGDSAIIRPFGLGSALTPLLPAQKIEVNIPGAQTVMAVHPPLAVGADVVFVLFEDGTGTIIAEV